MKISTTTSSIKADIESLGFKITRSGKMFNAFAPMYGGIWFEGRSYNNLLNEIANYFYAKFPIEEKSLNANDLKVGSIVKMWFITLKSNLKSDWTIIDEHQTEGVDFITYTANCKVCNVTSNFFTVIVPHLNEEGCKHSKKRFAEKLLSDGNNHKIISI